MGKICAPCRRADKLVRLIYVVAALYQLATYIRMDSTWAGEDVICAAANALSRPIHVYYVVSNNSPLKYLPSHAQVSMQSPLLLAFSQDIIAQRQHLPVACLSVGRKTERPLLHIQVIRALYR